MKTERYIEMKSPMTGGRVKLVEDIEEHEFRGDKYTVHVRYCTCEDTGEQFTIEGQDDFALNQLYSQYRQAHGIPFADEIASLRKRYDLNYTQIGKIMGFGVNQWKQYEQGVVPSESNGKIILTIRSKQCMISLLEASRAEFSASEFAKVKSCIMRAPQFQENPFKQRLLYGNTQRGMYNGFSEMNCDKLQSMVRFLILREGAGICPTKLNKEMFYSDFLHYRRHGLSISGLQYRAIQYGPVPEHYDTIYDNIEGVVKESFFAHDYEAVLLKCSDEIKSSATPLSQDEQETLEDVSSILRPMSTSDVVELSHKEEAWKRNIQDRSIIPYCYAFELLAIA